MQPKLSSAQLDILIGNSAVNNEFSRKVSELSRRLKMNNLDYHMWDTMTDQQHDIFSSDLFLDGECASSPKDYVLGAVKSCGCPNVEEDLYHHSPALMGEIEKQQRLANGEDIQVMEAQERLDSVIGPTIDKILAEILP